MSLPSAGLFPSVGLVGQETPAKAGGTVVVWHEVTEARKLLIEQQARSEAEAQLATLQVVIDELPSGVCLIAGTDARLVLANRAARTVLGGEWLAEETLDNFMSRQSIQFVGTNGQSLAPDEMASLRALRQGIAVRHSLEVIRRPDGTSLPILVDAVALDYLWSGTFHWVTTLELLGCRLHWLSSRTLPP